MSKTNDKAAPPPDHYPLVIISDTHLGMKNDAIDLLCEFLRNTICDKLILNGDIIDGNRLKHNPEQEFPEAHKRVLDAINRKIVEGTEVIYTPGNHDSELRQMDLFGKTVMGMHFEDTLDLTDPKGRRLLVAHGDMFDVVESGAFLKHIPGFVVNAVEHYNTFIAGVSAAVDKVSDKVLQRHFRLATRGKRIVEGVTGRTYTLQKTATDYAREHGFNGVICGHFHHEAQRKTKDGITYLNSGDWVESFTAITLNKDGEWGIVKWPEKRRELGLKRAATADAGGNPDADFRPATEKMVAAIQKIWPGRAKNKPQSKLKKKAL